MTTRERVLELMQQTYYENIDRGDMVTATSALHEDVEWSHAQVWAHHGFARGEATVLAGRAAVCAYLSARIEQLRESGITHRVLELIVDGDRAAFIGRVTGPDGITTKDFLVWIEVRDDRIARYLLRPL